LHHPGAYANHYAGAHTAYPGAHPAQLGARPAHLGTHPAYLGAHPAQLGGPLVHHGAHPGLRSGPYGSHPGFRSGPLSHHPMSGVQGFPGPHGRQGPIVANPADIPAAEQKDENDVADQPI